MNVKLKPIAEQTVVITGASSGIGLATAQLAASRGARVVLASRNEAELARAAEQIRAHRGQAVYAVGDVASEADVRKIAVVACEAFGGIDTWVNNAGVSIYGKLDEVDLADLRRLFDVDFWGVVHGSLVALPHLRRRGGALINVGSILSERAMPMQGMYSAAKHAVKAFTDALRMELETEGAPVAVSLIKPAAIDTPYNDHAGNHMTVHPKHAAPTYEPEVVARAIVSCCERPVREITVGGTGKAFTLASALSPRLADIYMEKVMLPQTRSEKPPVTGPAGSLYAPGPLDGNVRGKQPGMRSSLFTAVAMRPALSGAIAAGALLAVLGVMARR